MKIIAKVIVNKIHGWVGKYNVNYYIRLIDSKDCCGLLLYLLSIYSILVPVLGLNKIL